MFSAACLITCVLRRLNIFSRELILEGITDLLTFSIAGIFMTILSGIILYWIHRTRVRRSYPEKMLHRIYCGIAIAVPVMILLVLLLTLINTLAGGALTPNITDPNVTKWLTFNVSWGVPGAVPGQQVPDASGRRTFCIKYSAWDRIACMHFYPTREVWDCRRW